MVDAGPGRRAEAAEASVTRPDRTSMVGIGPHDIGNPWLSPARPVTCGILDLQVSVALRRWPAPLEDPLAGSNPT